MNPLLRPFACLFMLLAIRSLGGPADAVLEREIQETSVTLADARITESSGLVRSLRHPGIFWTLNDSGGEPCVFALDPQGRTRAKVRLRDAANIDWEDIAIGRTASGDARLYVGDIGDNLGVRPSIVIYDIPEPDISPPDRPNPDETWSQAPRILHAAYPNHPRNAEGMFVHPVDGRIYLVTKSDSVPSEVWTVPAKADGTLTVILEPVAEISFPAEGRLGKRPRDNTMTTAADISPDGSRLLISTYSRIYEWRLSPDESLSDSLKASPIKIEPTVTRQMEAVAYDPDGHTLWFTSEQLPAPLVRIERRK